MNQQITTRLIHEAKDSAAVIEATESDSGVQVNVFLPPEGAGFFLVFPVGERQAAIEAAKKLIEGPALSPDEDITRKVPGCVIGGTVTRPGFKAIFKPAEVPA